MCNLAKNKQTRKKQENEVAIMKAICILKQMFQDRSDQYFAADLGNSSLAHQNVPQHGV